MGLSLTEDGVPDGCQVNSQLMSAVDTQESWLTCMHCMDVCMDGWMDGFMRVALGHMGSDVTGFN